ncbi:hypothetical protein INT48_006021 [Thamnidium elegans]|uniref:Uncharacterized protein n=1 Tax=Thamnidium elegans TaxID=101142 RepID=A0A8H7VRM4_9FUNG|nr:hypothetical protein INT48_006021 [Thamnidium elegans]
MSSTHLESLSSSTNMTTMASHSRKSQRVYRSPSNANEQLFYIKKEADTTSNNNTSSLMEIDAEDEEAGTILMSLAQHANRIRNHPSSNTAYDEKPARNPETDASIIPPHVSPYHSLSSESKPTFNNNKKGFQICIAPRTNNNKSFRHPSTVRIPIHTNKSIKHKRNTTHIHISYRIYAHRTSLTRSYETSPYPSAFRAPPNQYQWNTPHPHQKPTYHYQSDTS